MLDSASGTITVRAQLAGSLDSIDVNADADGTQLDVGSVRASRLHASASLTGLPGPLRGRFTLRADSVVTKGVRFSTLTATAVNIDSTWLVRLGTSPDDRPGGETSGSVSLRADTVAVGIDSLLVRIPGSELRLVRPTRIRFDTSGTIVVDTVELRGTRGALLQAAGVVRDTGAIAVSVTVSNVPIHLASTTGSGDSLRTRIDARADVGGTARDPVATLRSRVRLIDADSLSLDSIIGEVTHERGTTRLRVTAHGENRGLFLVQATGPTTLSFSPFRAEVPDDSITGEMAIDSLDLSAVARIIPGIRTTAGVLRMKLALSGTTRHPRAAGTTELRGGVARIDALGIDVRDATATLDLSHDRLTITASVSGGEKPVGRAEVAGFIGLGGNDSTTLRVRSSFMPVMRLAELADLDVTSDLQLVGVGSRPTLSGTITVDRGVIRMPEMGSAGIVGVDDTAFTRLVDSLAPVRASRSPPGTSAVDRMEVGRIVVSMGPNVWLRSSEANIQIGGSIGLERATNPATASATRGLALRGALITERGNYRFSVGHISRLFELEQGSVTFTGEPELNPRLDINALYEREGSDPSQGSASSPRVRLRLGGTLEKPTLSFSSADAKLSQSELMSYLITGQTHFALGDMNEGAVSSELVASATDALAQRIAGGVFDVVNVTAGSTTTAGRESRGAAANVFATSRLGVGKQLSPRVFLKVDAGLCALAGGNGTNELWQSFGVSLDYRFRRGLLGSLSSAPSTNGANCSNQAGSRGTALAPRQWGFDFNRTWRF
jgi:autotransporter translocation and assembly factor TamB